MVCALGRCPFCFCSGCLYPRVQHIFLVTRNRTVNRLGPVFLILNILWSARGLGACVRPTVPERCSPLDRSGSSLLLTTPQRQFSLVWLSVSVYGYVYLNLSIFVYAHLCLSESVAEPVSEFVSDYVSESVSDSVFDYISGVHISDSDSVPDSMYESMSLTMSLTLFCV